MRYTYSYIFEVARRELDKKQFELWLGFAYGILEADITDSQARLLWKGLGQDIQAQKLIKNKT